MGYSGGVAGGVAASSGGRGYGGGGEHSSEKERTRYWNRSTAEDIISKMDDIQEARKKAIERNKEKGIKLEPPYNDWETGELLNVKKIISERIDIGEKAVERIQKEGGVSEARGAIEALEEVVQQAKNNLELKKDNPEVSEALTKVIEDAENNLNIRKAVFDHYTSISSYNTEYHDPDRFKKQTNKDDNTDVEDEKIVDQARERVKEAYKNHE